MEEIEQWACSDWVATIVSEAVGAGQVLTTSWHGVPNKLYKSADIIDALSDYLPSQLTERLLVLIKQTKNWWGLWPKLTEAELGTIMQAGADKFLGAEIHV